MTNAAREKLSSAGFQTLQSIITSSSDEICRLTKLAHSEVETFKKEISLQILPKGFITAYDLDKESNYTRISIGSDALDNILNGGIRKKCLTELYGQSGCGKSQVALQMTANWCEKGVVYICTEDTFPSKRLHQIMKHRSTSSKNCGDNIFIHHLTEVDQLMNCLKNQLPILLQRNSQIELVVIDSIAAPFRGEHSNTSCAVSRAKQLKEIGFFLMKLSKEYNLAILCINQVSAVVDGRSNEEIIPSLGLAWSNMITERLELTRSTEDQQIRQLRVIFSPEISSRSTASFMIAEKGLIGI